ncbi:MAG: hypothetical protein AAFZ65_11540, partial [Planctomycetota bacterium]
GGGPVGPLSTGRRARRRLGVTGEAAVGSSSGGLLGAADAAIQVPGGSNPNLAGLTFHHAFVAIDPASLTAELASDSLPLQFMP